MFVIQRTNKGAYRRDEFLRNVAMMEGHPSIEQAQRFLSITAIFNAVSSRRLSGLQLEDEYHIVEVRELPPTAPTVEIVRVL